MKLLVSVDVSEHGMRTLGGFIGVDVIRRATDPSSPNHPVKLQSGLISTSALHSFCYTNGKRNPSVVSLLITHFN
jgi:hypothetical protein